MMSSKRRLCRCPPKKLIKKHEKIQSPYPSQHPDALPSAVLSTHGSPLSIITHHSSPITLHLYVRSCQRLSSPDQYVVASRPSPLCHTHKPHHGVYLCCSHRLHPSYIAFLVPRTHVPRTSTRPPRLLRHRLFSPRHGSSSFCGPTLHGNAALPPWLPRPGHGGSPPHPYAPGWFSLCPCP